MKQGFASMFERIRSKILLKIGVLIAIETIFIISSFGVLAYFQSEDSSLGNSINIAGKNRYLTATALYEAEKYLDSQSPTDLSKLNLAINNLESNILVLKQGGKTSGIEVKPLSPEFSGLWNIINEKGQSFKRFINENIIGSTNQPRLETRQKQSIRTELGSMASRSGPCNYKRHNFNVHIIPCVKNSQANIFPYNCNIRSQKRKSQC